MPHACPQSGRARTGWRRSCKSAGRCVGERRVPLKAVTVNHLSFHHGAQVLHVTRKTRDLQANHRRWPTVVVYAITSLPFAHASPARLTDLIRGHWAVEALHHIRDTTYAEDASQLRTGTAPQVMATLRNLAIGVLGRAGPVNLAAALRHHARDPARPLATLGITPHERTFRENAGALPSWDGHGGSLIRPTKEPVR